MRRTQTRLNIIFYAVTGRLLHDSTIKEYAPCFAFVVVIAIIVQFILGLHANKRSGRKCSGFTGHAAKNLRKGRFRRALTEYSYLFSRRSAAEWTRKVSNLQQNRRLELR
jgi:uncharacterized membrane protein